MAVGNLFSAILSVVLLITLGYLVKRLGLLSIEDRRIVNLIIVNLAMPALVFRSVKTAELSVELLAIPLLAIAVMVFSMGAAFLMGRALNLEKKTFGAFLLVSAIGNTGYLGYPLTVAIFSQDNLVRSVFYDIFGTILFVFTVGVIIAQQHGDREEELHVLRELFTFPPLIGLVVALILYRLALPGFLTEAVDFMANATIPLIMLSIGLSLELGHVLEHRRAVGLTSVVKLGVSPLIALGIARLLGFGQVDAGISVLEASMPSMMFSLVIGLKYGLDVEFLPAAIVGTTILSLVTVPFWQYLV
ncbi:MAG: AEC family transporter [Candidatus Aquicultorales bacterium]